MRKVRLNSQTADATLTQGQLHILNNEAHIIQEKQIHVQNPLHTISYKAQRSYTSTQGLVNLPKPTYTILHPIHSTLKL